MSDKVIVIPHSEYNEVIIINKYNEEYSLAAGRKGKDGKNYMEWVFAQDKDRKPREKSMPLKIKLGDRNAAVFVIGELAKAFGMVIEQDEQEPEPDNTPDEDQMPF